jgi:predicted DNA-binding protein (MmcQ/YjbR family)
VITAEKFKTIALSFAEAEEAPHHEVLSYRIKKKIFATLNIAEKRATVKLNAVDQSAFCSFDSKVVFPVPNVWGKQGWTHINLQLIQEETLLDLLTCAYCQVAPAKYAKQYREK